MEFMADMLGGADAGKLSVFELVAQHKMAELLEPAVRHITAVYAHRYPRYLVRVLNWHEEVFAALMVAVERHYLRRYGASFAEHFYGAKRVRTRRIGGSGSLTRGDQWASVALLVGVPLVKSRLDQYYDRISGGDAARLLGGAFAQADDAGAGADSSGATRLQRLRASAKHAFRRLYPHANFAYHAAAALYYVAYTFDRTRYSSPALHVLGLQLRRLSAADHRAMDARAATAVATASSGSLLRLLRIGAGGALDVLKTALPLAIFFYRFLEWWHRSDFHRRAQQPPMPPPPKLLPPHPDGVAVPGDQALCPLCCRPRTNPAMAPTGYVFCYPCIHRHVAATGACPVTLAAADAGAIRKLYADA
ncbi:ubiquitin-protein ligase peroxin 12 [Kickxella alabastrina]|uniref:Ubiquitin-protein ligase peroxin 12 n=1 Tax=Kickxella alabastrina TaxID=61397 RepID=A0ACC1IKB5_9FUNG|nr:ubiquitin-protein ligase peroxin 12 [Kickxella alabastrina]